MKNETKRKNLYSAPKRPARTRLYEPTQGTAQIGSLEKSYKLSNYTAYIQKKKWKWNIVCALWAMACARSYKWTSARACYVKFCLEKACQSQKKSLDFGFFCDVNQNQAPVVQKLDSAIHQINRYPKDEYYENQLHYPVDSDLSNG